MSHSRDICGVDMLGFAVSAIPIIDSETAARPDSASITHDHSGAMQAHRIDQAGGLVLVVLPAQKVEILQLGRPASTGAGAIEFVDVVGLAGP